MTPVNEKPVRAKQQMIVELTGEGKKGDGLCKVNGFIIVVPKGQEGKKYEIQIQEVYEKCAFAKILRNIPEDIMED